MKLTTREAVLLTVSITTIFWALITRFVIVPYSGITESTKNTIHEAVKESMEVAYFIGQKDAINGEIHVGMGVDSTYVWISSPYLSDSMKLSYYPKNVK